MLERRTTEDSSSRRIMRLVPAFTLETNKQTNNKCSPKFVETDNASSGIFKDGQWRLAHRQNYKKIAMLSNYGYRISSLLIGTARSAKLVSISSVDVTAVAGRFANLLRRFANVFSPTLMAHCRDSKLHFFNWQQFICLPHVTTFGLLNLFKKSGNLKFGYFDPLRMITASCSKR